MIRSFEFSKSIPASSKSSSLVYSSIRPNSLTKFNSTTTRNFRKASANRSFSFSHYQNQSEDGSSSASEPSSHSLQFKLALGAISILSFYGVSTYAAWSLQESYPSFYHKYENYIPLGHKILEFLEERQYQEKLRTRKQFYDSQNSVEPYISKTYHEGEENHDKRSHAKATSSEGKVGITEDPLSPEGFFDAKSGTVGLRERDYLPLVQLPDIRDPIIHDISMSLNDLISSVNASAVSDETVTTVAKHLHRLSQDIQSQPHLQKDSELFEQQSQMFDSIVENIKQLRPKNTTDEDENRLFRQYQENYHKKLSIEILKAERVLIAHCNTRNSTKKTDTSVTNSTNTTTSSTSKHPFSFSSKPRATTTDFAFPTADILDLQISLTLLIAALNNNSSLQISPYVEGIKASVASSSTTNKEQLLQKALQGVNIPEGVDIGPIIQDILSDYK